MLRVRYGKRWSGARLTCPGKSLCQHKIRRELVQAGPLPQEPYLRAMRPCSRPARHERGQQPFGGIGGFGTGAP
jgi:hypothetical protein